MGTNLRHLRTWKVSSFLHSWIIHPLQSCFIPSHNYQLISGSPLILPALSLPSQFGGLVQRPEVVWGRFPNSELNHPGLAYCHRGPWNCHLHFHKSKQWTWQQWKTTCRQCRQAGPWSQLGAADSTAEVGPTQTSKCEISFKKYFFLLALLI